MAETDDATMMATRLRNAHAANNAAPRKTRSTGNHASNASSSGYELGKLQSARTTSSAGLEVPDLLEASAPPQYTIDLSLPPRERYSKLAAAYKHKLIQLPELFDEVLENLHTQFRFLHPWPIKQVARLLLRRIHDSEQMEELKGIQEATGIEMYLLVAFNVLLDMFVGCTSGGVRVAEKGKGDARGTVVKKMLHFRTLDWAMDPLRQIIVQLDFVAYPGAPVMSRSITYLGFVGVLTAVR